MNVRDAYNTWAATYDSDANATRDLDAVATRESLAHLRPASILELGCGTGKNTAFLAEIGGRVLALDFSEAMLAHARAAVTAPHVTFRVADLTRPWPHPDHAADLIVTNLVLEHIADLGPIFAEAARCLAPGGSFFVCELHPAMQYLGKQARFDRGEDATLIPAYLHHLTDFTAAADDHGLALARLSEWWATPDRTGPPRLASFLFTAP